MFSDLEEKLYLKILNYISYKPRSTYEVSARLDKFLQKLDAPDPTKETIMQRLLEDGILNDEALVQDIVFNFTHSSKHGSINKLKLQLHKKGISRDLIDKYVSTIDPTLEIPQLTSLIKKKLSSSTYTKIPTKPLKRQKLISYLLGKGFKMPVIASVIDTFDELK